MQVKTGLAAALIVAATLPAVAQTGVPSSSGNGKLIQGETDRPVAGRGDNLSSKLSESNGVIKPKADVDPGMKVPAPDPHPNSMPVVPPAATGGNSAK